MFCIREGEKTDGDGEGEMSVVNAKNNSYVASLA